MGKYQINKNGHMNGDPIANITIATCKLSYVSIEAARSVIILNNSLSNLATTLAKIEFKNRRKQAVQAVLIGLFVIIIAILGL